LISRTVSDDVLRVPVGRIDHDHVCPRLNQCLHAGENLSRPSPPRREPAALVLAGMRELVEFVDVPHRDAARRADRPCPPAAASRPSLEQIFSASSSVVSSGAVTEPALVMTSPICGCHPPETSDHAGS
jgi:hypothetical protein